MFLKGDIFELKENNNELVYIGCTTNGELNKEGKLIMGAGIAKEFKERFKGIEVALGLKVKLFGNRVFVDNKTKTFSFPTKNKWREKSDLNLIKKSFEQLKEIAISNWPQIYIVPYPGIGLGGLKKEEIETVLKQMSLPDNIYLIER